MEGDLTSELEAFLLFDFDFDHEVGNPLSQAHPNDQQNSTLGNLSHVLRDVESEHEETGSASGNNLPLSVSSQNLTGTTNITTTEQMNPSPEIGSNFSLPRSPSLDTIIGIPQAYNPTTEINREQQPSLGENTQAQLDWMHTNPSLSENTIANNFSSLVASSFNAPFSQAHQTYFQATVETIPEINEVSLNQLNNRPRNGLQNELLHSQPMAAPLNLSNTLPIDQQLSQNFGNIYFHNNSNQQAVLPYAATFPQINSTRLGITDGRSEINQPRPSCLPNYQNFSYNINPLTPSRPQINQRLAPNVQSSNSMLPSYSVPPRRQHQPLNQVQGMFIIPNINGLYDARKFYGYSLTLIRSNINCCELEKLLEKNSLYQAGMASDNPSPMLVPRAPMYQAGLASNNPIISSSMLLVPRGQELSNHGPINQAFPMIPYMTNPQLNNSLLLDPSTATRQQSLLHHLNQVPQPPTFQNLSGLQLMQASSRPPLCQARATPNNTIMPRDGSMLVPRSQELPNHGPMNQSIPLMPNMINPQLNNSLLLDSPMAARSQTVLHQPNQVPMSPTFQNSYGHQLMHAPSRPPSYQAGVTPNNPIVPSDCSILVPRHQELPYHGPFNQAIRRMPNMINSQLNNSLLLATSTAAGGQELPNHGRIIQAFPLMSNMINQQLNSSLLSNPSMSTRLRETYCSPDSSQLRLNLNSTTQQQAFAGQLHRGLRRRLDDGESSSRPKRARWDFTGQERGPQLQLVPQSESQSHSHVDNSFKSVRPMQNFLYDPLYESIGQPVDPHLRCLARKK